ncbi:DUF1643 domain-containing protein [Phormidium tenue FACHB-886]|nr:DUF1643 domain-containing protein [Phormidium tenue FACHB-886]
MAKLPRTIETTREALAELAQGAVFDATGAYRYRLWRQWSFTAPRIVFIMLNPSTADASTNDPTIRRCIGFAQAWGYGGLEVVNLFALKATQPTLLKEAIDPIGADCDRHLLEAIKAADRTVLAWGNWGNLHGRDRAVLTLLAQRTELHCLGLTQAGQPRHPLYLKASTEPTVFSIQS